MNFVNKKILITGASRGIGREIAFYFASLGCDLILTYNESRNMSNKIVDTIKSKYGVQVSNVKCSLECEEDVNNLSKYVISKYGTIDILINNAALSLDSFYKDKTKEEFMRVLEVNVFGTFSMMQKFMGLTKYVINISSTDAIDTFNEYDIDYACSKTSINCMTKYFALFDKNTKYYAICPNWVKTEAVMEMDKIFLEDELKRIGQDKLINPRSVALLIENLLTNDAISGSIVRLEGDIDE